MERFLTFDATLSQYLTLPPESGWWRWARVVAHGGDGPYVFGGLGLAYLLGWFWPDPFLRRAALSVALIVFLAIVVVTLIKFLVRRERPRPPGEFVTFQYDLYSFPSGHATRMAALSVGTLFFYPLPGWILAVTALSITAARVAVGIHYFGDIVVGLGLGMLVAWRGVPLLSHLF